jgi:hypothetical protein
MKGSNCARRQDICRSATPRPARRGAETEVVGLQYKAAMGLSLFISPEWRFYWENTARHDNTRNKRVFAAKIDNISTVCRLMQSRAIQPSLNRGFLGSRDE